MIWCAMLQRKRNQSSLLTNREPYRISVYEGINETHRKRGILF
jgi:hypothetical protein